MIILCASVLARSSDLIFSLDVNPSMADKAEPRPGRIATDSAELELPPSLQLHKSLVGGPPTTSRPALSSQLEKKTADENGSRPTSILDEPFGEGLISSPWWTIQIVIVKYVWLNDRSSSYLWDAQLPSSSSTGLETTCPITNKS